MSSRHLYCIGVWEVSFHVTPRVPSHVSPVELQPPSVFASQCAWLSKHWNSLPCGAAPVGTCSATHAHELFVGGLLMAPKASAMPEPHHVTSFEQAVDAAPHGFKGSAWHAACVG